MQIVFFTFYGKSLETNYVWHLMIHIFWFVTFLSHVNNKRFFFRWTIPFGIPNPYPHSTSFGMWNDLPYNVFGTRTLDRCKGAVNRWLLPWFFILVLRGAGACGVAKAISKQFRFSHLDTCAANFTNNNYCWMHIVSCLYNKLRN